MSMRCDDFAACAGAVVLLPPLTRRRRGILGTGVRRESHAMSLARRGVSPTGLCGRSTEASGDDLPVVTVDAGSGQMQHDASYRGLDPGTELHQMFAQRTHLGRAERSACGAQSQPLVEHIGCGGQKPAQLIGEEAGAAGSVDLQTVEDIEGLDVLLTANTDPDGHFKFLHPWPGQNPPLDSVVIA